MSLSKLRAGYVSSHQHEPTRLWTSNAITSALCKQELMKCQVSQDACISEVLQMSGPLDSSEGSPVSLQQPSKVWTGLQLQLQQAA